ncbi:MAG TPA: hypothetical protein VE959_04095 [Bryobacteraceae bacterium]|nr:hypothetical protein [Bryobacteraceae bacterium]
MRQTSWRAGVWRVAGSAALGAVIGALPGAGVDTAGMYPRRVQKLHMDVRVLLQP